MRNVWETYLIWWTVLFRKNWWIVPRSRTRRRKRRLSAHWYLGKTSSPFKRNTDNSTGHFWRAVIFNTPKDFRPENRKNWKYIFKGKSVDLSSALLLLYYVIIILYYLRSSVMAVNNILHGYFFFTREKINSPQKYIDANIITSYTQFTI